MTYRCTGAFIYADQVFPGGMEVADDHPILRTHPSSFVRVSEPPRAAETASAAPGSPKFVHLPTLTSADVDSPSADPVLDAPKRRTRPKKSVETTSASLPTINESKGS